MKIEKIPKDNFVIKIELNVKEAELLCKDLNEAEEKISFWDDTKELHKALKKLLE